jgi:hypothetical protein
MIDRPVLSTLARMTLPRRAVEGHVTAAGVPGRVAARVWNPLILLTVLLFTAGCDDGAQHGRFSFSGSSSHSLADITGVLTIVQGDALPLGAQSTGQQPLLYILMLAPSVTATGSGSEGRDGSYVSMYKESWHTPHGKVSLELSWDRRSDQVKAGGATFDRAPGNVFVLVRDAAGGTHVTQAGPLDAGLDHAAALPKIQALLQGDSPAKKVTLR